MNNNNESHEHGDECILVPVHTFEEWQEMVNTASVANFGIDYTDLPDVMDMYQIYCDGHSIREIVAMIREVHDIPDNFIM